MSRLPLCRLCRTHRSNGVAAWCVYCIKAVLRFTSSRKDDGTMTARANFIADRIHSVLSRRAVSREELARIKREERERAK